MDYRSFLRTHPLYLNASIQPGRFLDEEGNYIAKHEGFPFYTIGQRRGLGIDLNRAVFVKEIHPETNDVVLGSLQSLEKHTMWLKDWHTVHEELLFKTANLIVTIRYSKQLNHGQVTLLDDV